MAVNLSPVAGAAAQFFDNSGNVLTGGLLYTYLAGTTTPAVTYTQSNGITAHANPIVLNAAGRVPDSGEIWLTDGVLYSLFYKTNMRCKLPLGTILMVLILISLRMPLKMKRLPLHKVKLFLHYLLFNTRQLLIVW